MTQDDNHDDENDDDDDDGNRIMLLDFQIYIKCSSCLKKHWKLGLGQ